MFRGEPDIRVQAQQPIAVGCADGLVLSHSKSDIPVVVDDAPALFSCTQKIARPIARRVVHHDHFEVAIILLFNGGEALRQKSRGVPGNDQD